MRQFADIIIYLASFVTALGVITTVLKRFLSKELEPLKLQIHKMDVKECRRFLIDFLIDIENGITKDEVQWKFAHDVYDHYINGLKENSYVKDKWERVVTNGHNE